MKSSEARNKIKHIFSHAEEISVRDRSSYEVLRDCGIESHIGADPVLYNLHDIDGKENICLGYIKAKNFSYTVLSHIDFSGKRVGLALRQ